MGRDRAGAGIVGTYVCVKEGAGFAESGQIGIGGVVTDEMNVGVVRQEC